MQIFRDKAFLLHLVPYRDNSVLAHLLTQKNGKVSFVVGGMKSKKSNKRAVLQSYRQLQVDYTLKPGLSALKQLSATTSLQPDTGYFMHCQYIHELLITLLPSQLSLPTVFAAYKTCLQQLMAARPQFALRHVEVALLSQFAALPNLTHCCDTQQALDGKKRYRLTEQGIYEVGTTPHQATYTVFEGDQILAFLQLLRLSEGLGGANDNSDRIDVNIANNPEWEVLASAALPACRFFISLLLNGRQLKTKVIYRDLQQMTLV